MEKMIIYLAIGLIFGFILDRIIHRGSKSKERSTVADDKNAYIRGLKYIIANQPNKAIAEFSRAVQIDSNTIEIYQDLGNLFREQGETNKAIQIHHSILLRPLLDKELRIPVMVDLGHDYARAGFSDRAIKIFKDVIQLDPHNLSAYQAMEKSYQEQKNWEQAYNTEKQIQKLSESAKDPSRLAFLMTEIAKEAYQKNDYNQAIKSLKEAIALDKNYTEAFLLLGEIYLSQDKAVKAIAIFEQIVFSEHRFASTIYKQLEKAYLQKGTYEKIEEIYKEILKQRPQDVKTRLNLADYYYKKGLLNQTISELREGLRFCPESTELHYTLAEMLIRDNQQDEAIKEYQYIIEEMKKNIEKNKASFSCQNCGYQSSDLQWRCPQCQEMDSLVKNQV